MHGIWSFVGFIVDPRPLCLAAVPVWIFGILAKNHLPPSICLLDGVGPVQSNICFLRSKLPKPLLPTSPHHAPLVFSASFGEAWRSHSLYLGIFEFFHSREPIHSLLGGIPTIGVQLIRVSSSTYHIWGLPALFSYLSSLCLEIYLSMPSIGTFEPLGARSNTTSSSKTFCLFWLMSAQLEWCPLSL